MRTIIDLPPDQIERLAQLCAKEHISRAEAVRRAVAALIEERDRRQSERKDALRAGFGLWKGMGIDTDAYLAEIRSEWER
ncbi:MAG: ribbon-helix-helix protein, CopG family [Dehalococcoidia bacterium]